MTKKNMGVNVKDLANQYIEKGVVADFNQASFANKLSLFQSTPEKFIKYRVIGKNKDGSPNEVPYIEHTYAKKALNLVFNFQISNFVEKEDYLEYVEKYKYHDYKTKQWREGTRKVIEAECTVRFICGKGEDAITRTVKASHKLFENGALTRGDAMKAAFSKAWTQLAETFGITADVVKQDPEMVGTIVDSEEGAEDNGDAPQKSFVDLPY